MPSTSRRHVIHLCALLSLGAALRLVLTSGYGLGDDHSYFAAYAQMARGPLFDPGDHYSNRLAMAVPVAFSLWISGFSETGFIAPITIAALLNMLLIYLIASDEWDPQTGLLALALFAALPLEVLCATLFSPDTILATYAFGAYWLFGRALAATPKSWQARALAASAGLLIALGYLAKPWCLLVLPLMAWESLRHLATHRETLFVTALAIALPISAHLVWQSIVLGDALHHIHVDQAVASFAPYDWNTWLEFPAMLLRLNEYGTLFAGLHPHLLLLLVIYFWRRSPVLSKWLICCLFMITAISAAPAHQTDGQWETLVPRIFRYLTFISIPLCLALTAYLREGIQRSPRAGRALVTLLLMGSVPMAMALTVPTRDAFAEMRRVGVLLAGYPDDIAYMQSGLSWRHANLGLGNHGRNRSVELLAETTEARNKELAELREGIVVTGGAGLPWYGCPRCRVDLGDMSVPSTWQLMTTFTDDPLTAYRSEPLRIWRVSASRREADTLLAATTDRFEIRAKADRALAEPGHVDLAVALYKHLRYSATVAEAPELLLQLGRACLAANRPVCAVEAFGTALQATSDPALVRETTAGLIHAYIHPYLTDYASARALRDELLSRFPDTRTNPGLRWSVSRINEAQALYHTGHLGYARRMLDATLADPDLPDDERDRGWYLKALVAFRQRAVMDGIAARDTYFARRGADHEWVELLYREAEAHRWDERTQAIALLQRVIKVGSGTVWPERARALQHRIKHPAPPSPTPH